MTSRTAASTGGAATPMRTRVVMTATAAARVAAQGPMHHTEL
ncbi:MAG: hypothetical protein ACYC2O_06895 [Microthrixaceae bacterium]